MGFLLAIGDRARVNSGRNFLHPNPIPASWSSYGLVTLSCLLSTPRSSGVRCQNINGAHCAPFFAQNGKRRQVLLALVWLDLVWLDLVWLDLVWLDLVWLRVKTEIKG